MKSSINVIDAVIEMAMKVQALKKKCAIMKRAFKMSQQNHLDALDVIIALKKKNDTLLVIAENNERTIKEAQAEIADVEAMRESACDDRDRFARLHGESEERAFSILARLIDDGVDYLYHMRDDAETIFYARYHMWRIENPGDANYRDFYRRHWDNTQVEAGAMYEDDRRTLMINTLDNLNRARYPLRDTTGAVSV